MPTKISKRLLDIIDAVPLRAGIRVLEIGCGSGVVARELVNRADSIYILGVDRSLKAIEQAKKSSKWEIESGKLKFLHSKIEDFERPEEEQFFDIALAIRVGALDGRHPEIHKRALEKISRALKNTGKLFIDGGDHLKEIDLRRKSGL